MVEERVMDILKVKKGVIIHQVNNRRVMGAGIAKQIRAMYPQHYYQYKYADLQLGSIVKTKVNNKFAVFGIVGQDGYGSDGKCYTNYNALKKAFKEIAQLHELNPNINYYIPMGIGCGYGGGDWKIVKQIVNELCPFIIVCRFQ